MIRLITAGRTPQYLASLRILFVDEDAAANEATTEAINNTHAYTRTSVHSSESEMQRSA